MPLTAPVKKTVVVAFSGLMGFLAVAGFLTPVLYTSGYDQPTILVAVVAAAGAIATVVARIIHRRLT